MPSVYDLKPKFQSLLRPIVGKLASSAVTANQVTIAAVLLSVLGGGCIALNPNQHWPLALMPIILLVRMALNAVDGMLAREFGQKSRLGAILNELGDVVSDVVLYLPLCLIPEISRPAVIGFVIVAVIVEFSGVLAVQIGSDRRYDGPMGKSDRAFWVGLVATLLAVGVESPSIASAAFWCFGFLGIVTIVRRARQALES
jgi:CDP-diacylglycerol--glycerol-3-phosphate 3-phosphatidyltransferase